MRIAALIRPVAIGAALLVAALLGATLLGASPAAGAEGDDPYSEIIKTFRRKMKGATVERAASAIALLDPANPRSLPELVGVLAKGHWFVRGTAIEAVAAIPDGPLRSELRLHLVTHEDPWVREGIAYAMSVRPVVGDGEALIGAMDDADWHVRRTAARALGEIVSRDGVERLIGAIQAETDLRVMVWVGASLRGIVGRELGRDPAIWAAWWERNKDRPEWKRQGDEVTREEFAGIPLETFTVDSPVDTEEVARRRNRPDLFVLAPFGYTHDYFRPYLDEAAQFVRITYVTLPTVQELTGQSGYGRGIPVYPVDRLARALDELREAKGKEQIIVMAAGPVIWIAEKYALRFPKRTAGLVLVNGWLDRESYGNALLRLGRDGTRSEKWAANLLLGNIDAQHTPEEGQRLRRVFLTHALTDRRDSEAWRLWRRTARDHGFVTVPDIQFTRRVKIETPTLFTFPGESPFSGGADEDLRRIRASFKKPTPVTAVLRDSRGMAHMEDPQEFLRILERFLRYQHLID